MNARFRSGFRHIWQRLVYGRWWCACLRRRNGSGLPRPEGTMRARRSTQLGLAGKCGGRGDFVQTCTGRVSQDVCVQILNFCDRRIRKQFELPVATGQYDDDIHQHH